MTHWFPFRFRSERTDNPRLPTCNRRRQLSRPDFDPGNFETYTADNGAATEVRLPPIEVVRYWYHSRNARITDARTAIQYEQARIADSEFSPAPNGGDNDPVAGTNASKTTFVDGYSNVRESSTADDNEDNS